MIFTLLQKQNTRFFIEKCSLVLECFFAYLILLSISFSLLTTITFQIPPSPNHSSCLGTALYSSNFSLLSHPDLLPLHPSISSKTDPVIFFLPVSSPILTCLLHPRYAALHILAFVFSAFNEHIHCHHFQFLLEFLVAFPTPPRIHNPYILITNSTTKIFEIN